MDPADEDTVEASDPKSSPFESSNAVKAPEKEGETCEDNARATVKPVYQRRTRSFRAKRGLPISASKAERNLQRTERISGDLQCDIGINGSDNDTDIVASITHKSASLSARASRKRPKFETEISDLLFDYEKLPARLQPSFFECNALELAPKLLGKFLRRDDVVMQITEVEAYCPGDSACHGRFGITPRTAAMFGPGGHAYVYLCYGLHMMLNITADIEGVGAAVLIRSCAPIAGLQSIQCRRGVHTNKPALLTGPGKVGQALGLSTEWSSHPLYTEGGLELLDGPAPENILVGPRVGIDYASAEDAKALWRFAIAGTPWISAPRNNLVPLKTPLQPLVE
ncbi:hypothetical protein KP509_07G057300 [Ceratopteris richardii]|uniref:DNA-3-methyladenine glycosylase II n=1 Tax=Ceratopteris richardii TaxID=49495 RepID=A0A8T2UHA7_CERRI|nr:hypothetical protein KP509_07G057300 [Ceratopteris richardii]